ncbi:MAG: large subunit ribosomal protein L9 [Cycloclasticus pugetii]|jgi:large subunit ribosomal protein L9|uniref:Large ribosomal subunit protein bL9 n=2 Tax=Cycloclasticus TaxID=34067 RepID=S5T8Y0_9GAMM|nr:MULTISPECIES: 50S ribosomal protein L9 [Cycloclasticus]AFT66745.1 50S ribosomal protein L9 [Cycloclasticus sp. P1]AGS40201.1 50S ribosomal protein L9 [Cycloclasticus zancles 78-ME]ATI03622.1 50S ribosomal protein L9 [Cycloclasticus sp. PY97N]EPD14111.1 50S ribosomal protein L9 [Cycloclasticus pugetii]MBV1898251.1 50S ribosomal protein L9 [Cycloclasticus sp.]|tara:strand:+ start:8783 stop:9232 length:450 start_codon:yes stop_codon:yes gene_type:complete
MNIILLEKVANLGNLGDKVTVRPGFGRNFLIPGGKAVLATPARIKEFEARRADLEKAEAERLTKAQARAEAIEVLNLTITHQAGEEGKLFGSVGLPDIIKACADAGVEVDKQEIKLPEGSIRQTGEFEVAIHLHTDVVASLKLAVVAEA